jgi:predicted nucleotidyltransferase
MYLVQSGSLTIVARTPREAMRIRERLEDGDTPGVRITDMDGREIDIEKVAAEVED